MPGRNLLGLFALTAAVLGMTLGGCRPKTDGQGGAAGGGRPAILRVKVSPDPPRVGDRLVAEAEGIGTSAQALSLAYRWTKNGTPLENASGSALETKGFKKGDKIGLTVVPRDAQGEGGTFTLPEMELKNSIPNVSQASFNPAAPVAGKDLTAVVQAEDRDGDGVTFRYQWMRNGQTVPEAKAGTLPGNLLKRGDAIEVKIIPWDGSEAGSERALGPVKVQGRPPVITSEPPADGFAGGFFSYRVTASEPDGEKVAFGLTQGPSGMTISPGDGLIRWTLPSDRGKTYAVTVRVTDEEGAWEEQSFTIRY